MARAMRGALSGVAAPGIAVLLFAGKRRLDISWRALVLTAGRCVVFVVSVSRSAW
jgi:hypothetical protein